LANSIFTEFIGDDATAVAKSAAASLRDLREQVKALGSAFTATNIGNLTVDLKAARSLFKDAGGNIKLFKASLQAAGVSALDQKILLSKMNQELAATRKQALGMTGIFSKIFNPRTIWVTSHALNIASKGLGAIKAVAGAVYGSAKSVGVPLVEKVLDAAEFRESTLRGLNDLIGDEKKANDSYLYAVKLATKTPLETRYIVDQLKNLISVGGFNPEEAKYLLKIVGDQASKFGPEVGEQVVTALSRVNSRGYANARDIGESLLASRLSPRAVYEELAPKIGLEPLKGVVGDPKTEEDRLKQIVAVRKQLSKAGNIGSATFINAVIRATERKAPAGAYAEAQSQTLAGVFSNAKEAFDTLVQSVSLEKWPGIESLRQFLLRITKAFGDVDGVGKKVLSSVQHVIDALFGGLDSITDADITSFFDKVEDWAISTSEVIQEAWRWFDRLIHGQGGDLLGKVSDTILDVGRLLGHGIKQGILGGTDETEKRKYGVTQSELKDFVDLSKYSDSGTGLKNLDFNTFSKDYERHYAAFKAAGQGIPKAGLFEDQTSVTINAVEKWAAAVNQLLPTGQGVLRKPAAPFGSEFAPGFLLTQNGDALAAGVNAGTQRRPNVPTRPPEYKPVFNIFASSDTDAAAISQSLEAPQTAAMTSFWEKSK
jgi:hypothetical protein